MAKEAENIKATQSGNILTIVIDLSAPARKSKSEKTLVIGSTNGNQQVGVTGNNEPIYLGINCFYKPAKKE